MRSSTPRAARRTDDGDPGARMIAGVLHFSFTVSDIEQSVAWYRDVLGLELVHRQRQDNAYTKVLVGIPGAILEIAQFKVPGVSPGASTHMLELVEYVTPRGRDLGELATNSVGCAHLALLVTDLPARYERLRALGVEFRNPPVEITEGVNAGGSACYFSDLDGITLELLQPSPARLLDLGLASS
jgi:catechol 2,3-dioxygenase-like lactoylglutathione lyase family enzyme